MIFLGDLACPDERVEDFLSCVGKMKIFDNETVVVNLEGAVVDNPEERKGQTLYNSSRISEAFPQAKKVIVSLANNHMYDYPEKILETKEFLEDRGIGVFGLVGDNGVEPYEFIDVNGNKIALFGHCWRLYTKTNTNKMNSVRVVDQKYSEFTNIVADYIRNNPDADVYCFMHWNYDFEVLPFPLLRKVSYDLIDAGVKGVIGSHSHLPQGVEIYKDKVIAYCLGNFYLPSGVFFDGTLNYPDECKKTYGIKTDGSSVSCVWFDTDKRIDDVVQCLETEAIDGKIISQYCKFKDIDANHYVEYFKSKRVNRLFVPVFGKFDSERLSNIQESFAIARVKGIKALQKIYKKGRA